VLVIGEDHGAGELSNEVVNIKRDADGFDGRLDLGKRIGGEDAFNVGVAVVGVQVGTEGDEAKGLKVVINGEAGPGGGGGGRHSQGIPITLELAQKASEVGHKDAYFLRGRC